MDPHNLAPIVRSRRHGLYVIPEPIAHPDSIHLCCVPRLILFIHMVSKSVYRHHRSSLLLLVRIYCKRRSVSFSIVNYGQEIREKGLDFLEDRSFCLPHDVQTGSGIQPPPCLTVNGDSTGDVKARVHKSLRQVEVATRIFFTVVPNIFWSPLWNFYHVSFPASRNLR